MRKFIFFMILLLTVGVVTAENYTIKMLNTTSVNIGGKEKHVGDTFNEKAKINWTSDRQAMKVLSESNKLYILTPKLFKQKGVKDFSDFIASTKAATVRATDGFPVSVEDHKLALSGDFILMDSLKLGIGWKVDDKSYFIIEKSETGLIKHVPHKDGHLIFTPDLFDNLTGTDNGTKFSVKYVEEEYNDSTLITNEMNIITVPTIIN